MMNLKLRLKAFFLSLYYIVLFFFYIIPIYFLYFQF
jgi:hypothetical protein